MRFHVLAKPQFPVPPNELAGLAERSSEWQDRFSDNIEVLGSFPGGGGFAVVDVADEAELTQIVLEMPFSRFSTQETRPFIEGRKGWKQLRQVAEDRVPAGARR